MARRLFGRIWCVAWSMSMSATPSCSRRLPLSVQGRLHHTPYSIHLLFLSDLHNLALVWSGIFYAIVVCTRPFQVRGDSAAAMRKNQCLTEYCTLSPSVLVGLLFWNYFLTVQTSPGNPPKNWVSWLIGVAIWNVLTNVFVARYGTATGL